MIDLVKRVPEVYVKESRDFQLLARVYTLTLNYLRFFIDSLRNVSDTKRCLATSLQLLKTRLGFFNIQDIPNNELRQILICFPDLLKWKGSIKGIKDAVTLYTNIKNIDTNITIEYDKTLAELNIYSDVGFDDVTILNELFRYLLPTGVTVNYLYTDIAGTSTTTLFYSDNVNELGDATQSSSLLYASSNSETDVEDRNLHSVDTFTIYQNEET